ncbi:predicted protein [Plenodomus lingam JN3]|uniref:Predicted protein n=1 Tax=Leptosphaeria maculans (strain JN3 / isolate v23.1.3 / race Av1-4-5-6-7-8) TaxID=985895 RepID=E5ACW2_LEPMJ|nr:predicted protein [Plenodomus lingam JN3]CBY02314.1 predicted protein [Plenodomus lingam JN3]
MWLAGVAAGMPCYGGTPKLYRRANIRQIQVQECHADLELYSSTCSACYRYPPIPI